MIEESGTLFEFIGLELDIAGCPNSCRHCGSEGIPPCGELMSFDDAKWVVEQFRNLTKSEPPIVKWFGRSLTLPGRSLALPLFGQDSLM